MLRMPNRIKDFHFSPGRRFDLERIAEPFRLNDNETNCTRKGPIMSSSIKKLQHPGLLIARTALQDLQDFTVRHTSDVLR